MKSINRKVKIAEFVGTIQDGGAETVVKDYALSLDEKRFETIVIVLRRSPYTANDRTLIENGVVIESICKSNAFLIKFFQRTNYWWYVPYKLNKILKKYRIDVLHVHMPLLHYTLPLMKSFDKIRLFYTIHSDIKEYFGKNPEEAYAVRKFLKQERIQLIALHDTMKHELNNYFNTENPVVLSNGIKLSKYRTTYDRNEIRKELNIPVDAFVIGHIGRFSYVKNHEFIISVFEKAVERNDKCFLLLVGSGELQKRIVKKLIKDGYEGRYIILSHRADIPQILAIIDAFVFPSYYEGFGIAPLEAQASGCKCIISDGVPKDIVVSERCSQLSLNDGVTMWCDAVFNETIKGIPIKALEDYDQEVLIKKLERMYLGNE